MLTGIYDIIVQSYMGIRHGKLDLREEDVGLLGRLSIIGKETLMTGAMSARELIRLSGIIETPAGENLIRIIARIERDRLFGVAKLRGATLSLTGERARNE